MRKQANTAESVERPARTFGERIGQPLEALDEGIVSRTAHARAYALRDTDAAHREGFGGLHDDTVCLELGRQFAGSPPVADSTASNASSAAAAE